MKNKIVRMLLDPDGGQGGNADPQPSGEGQQNNQQAPAFDYEKLASLVAGKQTVAEDTVLKNYFKNQGLSENEMKQAIAQFKQQKADSQPDVNAMQTELTQAQAVAQQAQIQSAATMVAVTLGIDAKTIPYVLKMADLSQAMGEDGKVNEETIKNALNKVLEDVPALKPKEAGTTGFVQVGATGQQKQQQEPTNTLQQQVATKRWNRFNS